MVNAVPRFPPRRLVQYQMVAENSIKYFTLIEILFRALKKNPSTHLINPETNTLKPFIQLKSHIADKRI